MENENNVNETEIDTNDMMTEMNDDAPDDSEGSDETLEASSEQAESAPAKEQVSEEAAKKASAAKVKAWEEFSAALTKHAEVLGLTVKPQKGFIQFVNAATGHKLYIAKQAKEVGRVDTTLPMDALPAGTTYDLKAPNGRIACHVNPELETVSQALDILSKFDGKIRAPERKKAAAPAAPAAS